MDIVTTITSDNQAFASRYGGHEVTTLRSLGNGKWQTDQSWKVFLQEESQDVQGSNDGQPAMTGKSLLDLISMGRRKVADLHQSATNGAQANLITSNTDSQIQVPVFTSEWTTAAFDDPMWIQEESIDYSCDGKLLLAPLLASLSFLVP